MHQLTTVRALALPQYCYQRQLSALLKHLYCSNLFIQSDVRVFQCIGCIFVSGSYWSHMLVSPSKSNSDVCYFMKSVLNAFPIVFLLLIEVFVDHYDPDIGHVKSVVHHVYPMCTMYAIIRMFNQ